MASFSEWSNNKMRQATGATKTTGATQKAQTFSAWSNQKLGKEDAQKNPASGNTAFDRSGKTRDEYDSSVRQNYAARAAASDKLTEGEYNRSTAMQQKYGSYQNYLVGATADGKYYSQPEIGKDTEKLRNTYTTYEAATQKALTAYQDAAKKQKETEEALDRYEQSLPELERSYAQNPSVFNNALYQTELQQYKDLAARYEQEAADTQKLYGDYEQSYGKYNDALNAYNTYLTGEQEKYQNWRGTVRSDKDAINADIAAADTNIQQLQAQQKELQKQAQQLLNKVSSRRGGTNELMQWSQQAQALQAQAKAMDGQIAEAENAKTLLQEELSWADYYQYADLSADDKALGQYGKGNIDLYNRPEYQNPDGSISTVDSASYSIDGKEVLLPTVWMKDGKPYHSHDDEEILQHYEETGEYLGKFDTPEEANAYGEQLHRAQDFYYGSQYKSTKTGEPKFNAWTGTYTDTGYGDILYDYINGDEDAQSMQGLNDLGGTGTLYATTHGGWKDLPEDVVKTFNYLYAQDTANGDTEHKTAYEYLDKVASKGYTGIEAMTYGLLQGTGLASVSATLGSALGGEEGQERNKEWYGQFLKDAAGAKEEHGGMYHAGSIGGNLMLMYGVGSAAGAGAKALGMSTGALSTQMATGAMSFAGANALQNAGAAATRYMGSDDYLRGIAVSGVQGMAGNLAGGLVGSGMANLLRDKGLMTPFMEFVRQTTSGMTNATVNQAVGYVAADEKPSNEDIASGLVTAFAFSVLTGAISTYQTTQAQKSNMESAYKVIEQGYKAMMSGTENMTAEAKAQRAQVILEQTQNLRKSVNSYYIAGQQQAVNELNGALDIIEQAMQNYVSGYNAASAAMQTPGNLLPGAGSTGMLPTGDEVPQAPTDPALTQQVERGLQAAIQQGLTQQQPQTQSGTLAAAAAQQTMPEQALATQTAQGAQPETVTQTIKQELVELGEQPQTAQKTAQNIQAFLRGELTDGYAVTELVNNPAATQVLQRMMTQQAEQTTPAAELRTPKTAQNAALPVQQETAMEQPGMLPTAAEAESRTLNNGTIEGGTSYGTEQQGYDAADGRAIQLPDGDGRWIPDESTGGQSGILAEGRPQRTAEQSRTAVERQNTGRALRLQKVSSRELGLENGTDAQTLTVLPESEWDEGLQRTAQRVTQETGKPVTMVLGGIQIRTGGGGIARARGVYSDTGIILQADNFKLNTDQIAGHEIFHDYADNTPGLIQSVEQAIVEQYGREEFDKILTTYIQKLRGVIDLPENATDAEIEDALLDVKNEVFADAYAGINAFGAHAEKYQDTTRQTLEERGVITSRENAAATDRRTGPPERFSYAGANANGANLDSLREAQEMQEAGADMESIRKATGWHQFADGKWRFEIDDSRMQLRTDAADIPNYTTLGELVDAPELFEAYPDMTDLSVTFHTLEDGQNGGYSRKFDSIELSRELKNRPEALLNSLIHEVQHAIQNREGFASGANPAYWNRRMENGFDSRTAEERREGARLQEQYEQMQESDPQFVAAMEELDAMAPKVPRGKIDLNTWEQIEPDPPEWVRYDERRDQLEEQYGDRVWDWYSLRDSIDRNARNGGRMPTDLYRDTAGEIEARDTAKRRELTAQERRETPPDLGNEDTVFADGGDGYAMSQSEQDSVKEQLREHQDALNNMKAVATIRDNGWKGMSTGAFRQKIVNDLKKTGYRVDNPSIGVIDFDEKLLNRSLNYIQTDAEAVAYQALPQVLKRGIEISGHGNHKGRDYETLTIAAPVELNGKRGNMAVVVMKTKGNRYKVHRILTPEGEAFALPEMTNAELNTAGTVTSGSQSLGGSAPAISSASETDAAISTNPSPRAARSTASVSADSVAEKLPPVKKRFSIDEPVERTKDLIAVHNKDWSVIRDAALNWGGIPSPSVAIVDAAEGHTKYGDTSVVFPRATIDPEADPRNKVYGGDAWTPTKDNAIVEREVNYEARRAFDENIRNLSSQFAGGVFQGSGTLGKIGLENETRWEPAEIADKLANHPEVQAAFLQSEGKSLEPVYRDKQFDRFFSNATIQRYLDTVGEQEAARLAVKLMTGERLTAEEMQPAEQAIREVYAEEHANFLNRRPESKEKRIDYYMKNNVFPNRVEDFIRSAQEFYESGGSAGEIDKEATAAKMMEMITPGGSWSGALQTVKDWVQPQLEGLLGERGIYNGKDTVTDSGRRSFAQTHWDYTAENIVKAMNMAAAKGANMYGVTPETLAATATREYKNVDEMHADEARLRTVSEEEHAKALRDLGIYLDRVVNDLMLTTMHRYDNTFEEEQNLSRIIAEAAKGKKTTAAVKAAFRKEGYTISDGHAKSILALIDRAANIPTGYYEAKAQRVVPFSEAAAIIAPTSAPAEEIAAVKAATGVDIIQYETGNEEQRKALVNGLEGVRFSVDDEETDMAQQAEASKPEKKEKKPRKPKAAKPVAESLPIIAKRDLKQNLLNLFSIPDGMRAELGSYVDQMAERMLKNGELSQKDRDEFFDQMYASGVMEVEADEYYREARQTIIGRRIYVPEGVKHEFSDDWNSFRKQAFAAGVLLTNNPSDNGIDTINMELADSLPGAFDAQELDSRTILERIVQMAEEGKAEKMSLAEYTAMLAEQEYVSEDEVLDNIERQMDWALRTFAEKAKLEIKLRDRTGVKIAQEREKASDREQRARQHEAVRRADERQRRKEMSQRQRENRELKELQQKTLKALQWLAKNQQRAPEELRSTWDEVLGDIDIFAVGAANEMNWSDKYGATWGDLAQMYKDAQANDPNFLPSKELERIVRRLDDKKIADMDITALQDLYKAAVGLRTEFYNRNNVIGDEMNRLFADVYADSKTEIEDAPGGYNGKKLDKLMNLDQLSPMNVMQRMAGWNPESAFYSMARQLEKGERDIRSYTVKANRLLQDFLTEHEDWVKKADGQGKDAIWYEIEVPELLELGMGDKPIFGNTVKVYMTPAQKVHMYLESMSYDNLRHMAGGRTFADRELYSQGKRREAFAQGKTIRLAPETVKALVKDLTPEEQELAGLLENYYNQFASKEINRVSNILYGYDKAVSKNYAPIYTNTNYTKSELGIYDATAEGVGNLKSRQYSKNPSYNIGAFDAFERHIEQTARFVGMAVPARNWQTLLNWREKNNSMADVISHKWGDEGLKYIQDIVQTLQGGATSKSDSVSTGIEKAFSNYISAVFGANPSIVLKQLGSIPLAAAWLDFGNFPTPGQVRNIDRSLIAKYTQELDWRTMGYSMPETKQLKDNPNWTQSNKTLAFLFGGDAITAMDGWAASVLWPWAENKVRREHPELETGTQAQIDSGSSPFYQKVAEEFNEAVARSQSTSDEIHQGTLRKSKNPVTRAFTMFKSDSSQTYNALRQRAGEAGYYKRKGDTEKQHKANKALAVALIAAIGGYLWAQGITFLMNLWKRKGKAYRDDEGNLTADSVAKEMVTGLVGDLAGIVVGGEEIADIIGNIIDGDSRWYGIDTPGLEQLSDIIEAVINGGKGTIQTLKDMADVVSNGGDLGEYLHRHWNDIAGGIKEMAAAAATYLPGLPVNNLEAYLLGTVRWAAPELATAYEDALATASKSGLTGLTGDALRRRVNDILSNRRIETDDDTAEELAKLYEAGHTKAVPVDTPSSISVDGENRKLSAYQQQTYDKVWSGTVGSNLKELVASEDFQAASDETKAKMLYSLYDYAGEKAKMVLFEDYEPDSFAEGADEIIAAGASAADWAVWYGESSTLEPEEGKSGVSDAQKYALLQEKGYSDKIKQAIAGSIMGTGMETESGKPSQYAKMLQATQSGLGMDDYLTLKLDDAVDKYLDGIESGVDSETAFNMAQSLNELEPAEGKKSVSPAQKWRAAIDAADDAETQKAALKAVMTDDAWAKFEIADSFGIEPEAWVRLKETLPKYDADGNGSYKNAEVEAAIDGMSGSGALLAPWDMETGGTELYLTNDEKAVLWQLFTGSKSATGNPYSKSVARKVLEAKDTAKNGTEDAAEDSALPPWMR